MSARKINHWRNNLLLLLSIVFLFIIGPAIYNETENVFIVAVFYTILVFSGIYAADYKKVIFRILLNVGTLSIIILWLDVFLLTEALRFLTFISISIVLILITWALINHIAWSKIVNADILLSAINGYLLLGIVGTLAFRTILIYNPNALSIVLTEGEGVNDLIYFSFVTLSTLGYGEITPISPGARAVSMILSIAGPLYLTILIALLVGKFQTQNQNK